MSQPQPQPQPAATPIASIRLQHPEQFDFKSPDNWPKWKKRFQQFRVASGLSASPETQQVSTLLYCLGEEAESVLESTNITTENRNNYARVVEKFDEFFAVRKNVIFERARFNRRNQLDGETAEKYITELYSLVEGCNYGDLKEEMLRDRLVVGIRDQALSEKLQLDPALTLEKAKTAIRQKEAVREQHQQLKGDSRGEKSPLEEVLEEIQRSGREDQALEEVLEEVKRSWWKNQRKPRYSQGGVSGKPMKYSGGSVCTRCGRTAHNKGERCPATHVACFKCGKKGHYGTQCFSKRGTASANQVSMDSAFLDTVGSREKSVWTATVSVQDKKVIFKLDTGAEVTAISEDTFKKLPRVALRHPAKKLFGPTHQALHVIGEFSARLCTERKSHQEDIYVVRGLKNNLLGLPAITGLNLVKQLCETSAEQSIKDRFPKVFNGLGTMGEEYTIKLQEGAKPHALYTPRNVPLPLRDKVKDELARMESLGVISKVSEPTPWCAGMVVVPKKSGKVRICVDLKPLNKSVLREPHPIPKVDDTLAQLTGATLFSKLDANSGFWQIPLAEESRPLTTFITPFGRYCFNKLPFGISSAPELFQKRMSQILEGLPGVLCLIDDIIIFGKTQAEHDERLIATLKRLQTSRVTLNSEKCEFNKTSIKFLGHLIDPEGIRADPDKTSAICQMPAPQSLTDLRRFMGMVNQLGKFSPNIAELGQPLRELMSTKKTWIWGSAQEKAFNELKVELTKPTILTLYDHQVPTKVSADASSYGLGAVLLQQKGGLWKPVAYASRAMSETERHYAQIEKEALAVVWSCEKFSDYILGRSFVIETDHKPLVPLLNTKCINALPPRVLRFRLRLDRFEYVVSHVPGKELYTADTLSRAPPRDGTMPSHLEEITEAFVKEVTIPSLPAGTTTLANYRQAQQQDRESSLLIQYCQSGWPAKQTAVQLSLRPYWKVRSYLTVCDNLLLFKNRIVVPQPLRRETMEKIHAGHQGVERCCWRARMSVWWPGVTHHLTQMVQQCKTCAKEAKQRKEPMIPTALPDYPWQIVGTDLCEINGVHYIVTVDYFSRYPEVMKMTSTTSAAVINALKAVFSRHGLPEVLRSDNGPQYASQEFAQFADSYNFKHITSSPLYPQSNGQAERTVQTVKGLLKSEDPYMALLSYRATPLPWCGLSPAELSMGRKVRTTVPQITKLLTPDWPFVQEFRKKNRDFKDKQKMNYDVRHRVHQQSEIPDGSAVWIQSEREPARPGQVVSPAETPRSYRVQAPTGELRRNRCQLNVVPPREELHESDEPITDTYLAPEPANVPEPTSVPSSTPVPSRIMTRTQTGTVINPPNRL